MSGVLVDSNVLLDIATEDARWGRWSEDALTDALGTGPVILDPIIFAEISIRYRTIEEVDDLFPPSLLQREEIPFEAAFLAGKVFLDYRRRGGSRSSPLPDFFVGAHAAVRGYQLLTRDPRRYRKDFPTVVLISP